MAGRVIDHLQRQRFQRQLPSGVQLTPDPAGRQFNPVAHVRIFIAQRKSAGRGRRHHWQVIFPHRGNVALCLFTRLRKKTVGNERHAAAFFFMQ